MRYATYKTPELNTKSSKTPNEATIVTYERNVLKYLEHTPPSIDAMPRHQQFLNWIHAALELIPRGGHVFEVGSATPRDARYIRDRGYEVQCSDAAVGFVEYLRHEGEDAIHFNLLDDPLDDRYDMIFANAVLQHFTPGDVELILRKIYATLQPGKVFAFGVKQGTGEAWVQEKFTEPRYVKYWQAEEIQRLVKEQGFDMQFIDDSVIGDLPNHLWIHIVAQKPAHC